MIIITLFIYIFSCCIFYKMGVAHGRIELEDKLQDLIEKYEGSEYVEKKY